MQAAASNQLVPPVNPLTIVQHPASAGFSANGGGMTLQDLIEAKKGPNGASERRAAAIKKFREKKKARTFKKKVRYESRKKLAEKRPRIKGQFVRPEVAAAAASASQATATTLDNDVPSKA